MRIRLLFLVARVLGVPIKIRESFWIPEDDQAAMLARSHAKATSGTPMHAHHDPDFSSITATESRRPVAL